MKLNSAKSTFTLREGFSLIKINQDQHLFSEKGANFSSTLGRWTDIEAHFPQLGSKTNSLT